MQAKKAAPSFHGVVGTLISVIMLFVALGQRQRGRKVAWRLGFTLLGYYKLSWGCSLEGRLRLCVLRTRAHCMCIPDPFQ